MARGWESKSVEEQIASKESDSPNIGKSKLTPKQAEFAAKKEGLNLARIHTLNELQSVRAPRHRKFLEQRLSHIDSQLAELGSAGTGE